MTPNPSKIRYTCRYFDTPPEVQQVVQLFFENYGPLIERLVDRFEIKFVEDPDGEAFEAAIVVRREYRTATMFITAYFLTLNDEERRQAFCHELAHILTDPLFEQANKIVHHFVSGDMKDYVIEQLTEANELAVDDISRFFVDYKRV